MLNIGEIVNLNDKEYVIVNKLKLHNTIYYFLITANKPVDILIATESFENNNLVLKEIDSNEELDYILSKLVLTKE